MLVRSYFSLLLVAVCCSLAFAQVPPDPKTERDNAPQTFAFTFDGDGGYLGVQTAEVTRDNFSKYGLRDVRGVAVQKVMDNSPAAAAGLREGDVIVRLNSDEITSGRKLTRLIGEIDPDHQVRVTVLRNGSEQELTATLGRRPTPQFANGSFDLSGPQGNFSMPQGLDLSKLKEMMPQLSQMPNGQFTPDLKNLPDLKNMPDLQNMPDLEDLPPGGFKFEMPNGQGEGWVFRSGGGRQIGAGVYNVTKQLGERYGVDGGVMVNDVRDNSPAAKAGLRAGDIIVEVNGRAVKSETELVKAINEKTSGDVTLTVVRDRGRQTLTVTPEAASGNQLFERSNDKSSDQGPWPGVRSAPRDH